MKAQSITVGELVARFLEVNGVKAAFGVISIHNMPILDAFGERGNIRFVPARGEAGAGNMADAYARVVGHLGVAITSTGTAAGNIAGAMVEALTAGTPLLHITGQIDVEHLDKGRAYIHEAPHQLAMMKTYSKQAYRIDHADQVVNIMREACRVALTAPRGPVSVEIPIDIQKSYVELPEDLSIPAIPICPTSDEDVSRLANKLIAAKRPILWLGGGCRTAEIAASRLADMGIAIVTSTNGRAVVPEKHPMTLGAFNVSKVAEEFYKTLDLMIVVGSRLRGNETWTYKVSLPENMTVVDCNPEADKRCYPNSDFVIADAPTFLERLADTVEGKLNIDPNLANDVKATRAQAAADLNHAIQPYDQLVAELQAMLPAGTVWVRDVTLSNSMWGNRLLTIDDPKNGVHALGGGIGQGMPMGVGAAVAAGDRKTVVLCGDGGTNLCLGEFACLAEENDNVVILLMNDNGYGVIKNIQDDIYGSRKHYSDIMVPNYALISESVGLPHVVVKDLTDFESVMRSALDRKGASVVEIDMTNIGPFHTAFAGPPKRTS